MHPATGVALLVALVAIATWLALEVARFRRGLHVITGRQLRGRLVMGGLMGLVVVMIFGGVAYPWSGPAVELLYWLACLSIVCVVLYLALRDWREVRRAGHLQQAQLYLRLLAQQRPGTGQGEPPPPADKDNGAGCNDG